jgi:hypothetical protein
VIPSDWYQSYPGTPASPGSYTETLGSQDVSDMNDFGNWTWATKSGTKFEDLDADGQPREAGEPGLEGWKIYVDDNNNGVWDFGELYDITDADGNYTINYITPGAFYIREVPQTDWVNSFPALGYYYETFQSGEDKTGNDFGNWTWATKSGHKFYDYNYDGIWNNEEPALSGWIIYIDDDGTPGYSAGDTQTVTDGTGKYEFKLKPGTYTIRELMPLDQNWEQTAPASGSFTETFTSGQESLCNDFGNIYWNDETAWGYGLGGYANEFMDPPMNLANWGWTNGPISQPGMYDPDTVVAFELWADTGENYFPDGTQVGVGTIRYTSGGSVTVTYEFYSWVKLDDIHVWIGDDYLPIKRNGSYTDAPGQFNYKSYTSLGGNVYEVTGTGFSGDIYVAAHAVVEYAAKIPPGPVYPVMEPE